MQEETKETDIAAENAVLAVQDLIVSTLKDKPFDGRFAEAKRLCEVAQSLIKARARRAADFADPDAVHRPEPVQRGYQIYAGNMVANNTTGIITMNTANVGTNVVYTFPAGINAQIVT